MKQFFLISLLFSGMLFAQDAPKTMTKIVAQLDSPGAAPGSFLAKPKVMYRAGSRYCRIEEAADPENGIQGLVIVSEPDYWFVNVMAKTGKHGVDPGPTFNCHMPIFPDSVVDLEFCMEIEYFKQKGAAFRQGPVLQERQTTVYMLPIEGAKLGLYTFGTPERPLAVVRISGEKKDIFWYSGYGDLPFDQKLFAKPTGIKIEDSKP